MATVGTFGGMLQLPDMPIAWRIEMLQRPDRPACKLLAVADAAVVGMAGLRKAGTAARRSKNGRFVDSFSMARLHPSPPQLR